MTATANADQYAAWNGDSGQRWVTDPDRRDRFSAPVGDALLLASRLEPGEHVLDIGCGCGATTLAAARAVTPRGSVLGVDLSEPMLAVARHRLATAGHAHVTFEPADAQTHSFSPGVHDLAVSRFGTMFFDDPLAAFTNIATSLRAGGRICIATWQPLAANDWLTIPGAALLRYGTLPDTSGTGPGMFAQSDVSTISAVLTGAGFHDVEAEPVTVRLRLGADIAEATDHLADTGIGRAVLATIPTDRRDDALAAVASVLADHLEADGVHLNAGILITRAAR